MQAYVNLIWGLADIVILFTFFRFGRREFPNLVSRPLFIAWGVTIVASSFIIQWLFIAMFVARRRARGQSLLIAVAKWIGTLAPTVLLGFLNGCLLVIGISLLCSVFDLAYIGLLVWAKRRLSENRSEDSSVPVQDTIG
ncbi:hypothetical protein [Rathayibacter soli]|uniref:hypothetical protein n=1 Tax=Rathayibacter soli TaxID=3144168 RepID=UPI0027E3C141|nr:hypothetical protein [Glaciibacter superstes]